jgi:hypothetical protein
MKTFEKILVLSAIGGVVLKYFYIPGSYPIIFISVMILSILYFTISLAGKEHSYV